MKSKYPPGPYSAEYIPEIHLWMITEFGNEVAHVHRAQHAHLIASAPEMLETLYTVEAYLKLSESNGDVLKQVQAVIKKAEGEA